MTKVCLCARQDVAHIKLSMNNGVYMFTVIVIQIVNIDALVQTSLGK